MRLRRIEEGATAVITGASSGIGECLARQVIAKGGRVIAAARRFPRLSKLAEELGPRCLALELNVTNQQSIASLFDRLPAEWHEIDILVNNAGQDIGGKTRFDEQDADQWIATINTNLIGTLALSRIIAPGMLSRGGGQILNIGSTAGLSAYAGGAAYVASKFGVNGLSKALRLDYLGKIRVMEILPGVVRTEFDEVRRSGDKQMAEAFYSGFPECLLPADVAACAMFALTQPRHVNAAEIVVLPSA